MTRQRVTDHGHPRKYWTQVPNLVDDSDLDPFARTLLMHYLRIAGQRDRCEETIRQTATACRMSHGAVLNARRKLEEAGWVEVEECGTHGRGADQRIHILDRWGENMASYGHTHESELGNGHHMDNSAEPDAECPPDDQNVHGVDNSAANVHAVTIPFHHVDNSNSTAFLKREKEDGKKREKARAREAPSGADSESRECEGCGEQLPLTWPAAIRTCTPCARGLALSRAGPGPPPWSEEPSTSDLKVPAGGQTPREKPT